MKICKICKIQKHLDEYPVNKKMKDGHLKFCKACQTIKAAKYYAENKDKIKKVSASYRGNNKDKIKKYKLKYVVTRLQYDAKYNLDHIICSTIHNFIYKGLLREGKSKYLEYTLQELKEHLEKQFDSWMNWGNWGRYNHRVWDDNEPSTWTWQIDHIIPLSSFVYSSKDDDSFKTCWNLNNIRPLSSKENNKKGNFQKETPP